jgi:5-formyltetrahydrofolate cyclo-ligase
MTKVQIRREMLEKRLSMEPDVVARKSAKLIKTIIKQRWFKDAKFIAIYHPIKNEVNLLGLLDELDKTFALPKVKGQDLEFLTYEKGQKLALSEFNIMEPVEGKNISDHLDVLFVPALAIDKYRNRVGFGKGYFDRFFKRFRPRFIVGVIYDFQEYNRIKAEKDDMPVDLYFKG